MEKEGKWKEERSVKAHKKKSDKEEEEKEESSSIIILPLSPSSKTTSKTNSFTSFTSSSSFTSSRNKNAVTRCWFLSLARHVGESVSSNPELYEKRPRRSL